MATEWRYQAQGEQHGPVTFLQLAELLNDRVLNSQSLVKDDQSTQWRRVEEVAGLMAQARRLRAGPVVVPAPSSSGHASATLASPVTEVVQRPSRKRPEDFEPEEPRRPWGAYLGIVTILGLLAAEIWWVWPRTPIAFPESKPVTLKFETPNRLNQLAPRSRKDPKRLLAPTGAPVLIPGLESVLWAKNPVLTPDLLTIVYVGWGGDEALDDLYMAERPSTEVPFNPPKRLENCSTSKRETFPTLTTDGLQLAYAEDAGPTRLMIARRSERGKPFEVPQQLAVEKLETGYAHIDQPQFLSPDELRVAATTGDTRKRTQFLIRRRSGPAFTVTGKMGLTNPWPRYFLMTNKRRTYFVANDGLYVTMQAPRTPQFTTPERWLTDSQLGPKLPDADDGVWIAPTEDVIVFASPGLENPESRDRHLWMVRLD